MRVPTRWEPRLSALKVQQVRLARYANVAPLTSGRRCSYVFVDRDNDRGWFRRRSGFSENHTRSVTLSLCGVARREVKKKTHASASTCPVSALSLLISVAESSVTRFSNHSSARFAAPCLVKKP